MQPILAYNRVIATPHSLPVIATPIEAHVFETSVQWKVVAVNLDATRLVS